MATDAGTVAHICDVITGAGHVTSRKMFGEYALYCDGKVVALVCDDQLFMKLTPSSRRMLPDAAEGTPFPGAKPYLQADEALDDPDLLIRVVATLAAELPAPKPKKPRATKAKP